MYLMTGGGHHKLQAILYVCCAHFAVSPFNSNLYISLHVSHPGSYLHYKL